MNPETAKLMWQFLRCDRTLDACVTAVSKGEIQPWVPGIEATAVNLKLAAKFLREWADALESK